jgi:hypothetical protein
MAPFKGIEGMSWLFGIASKLPPGKILAMDNSYYHVAG